MTEFRKKQKRLYRLMKAVIICGAIFLFVYIGAQPYVKELSELAAIICNYICDGVVILILALVFIYYSKYGKSDSFLTSAENEINDNGYYISSRQEEDADTYIKAIADDLSNCHYSVSTLVSLGDFDAQIKAVKAKQFFYAVKVDDLDKNDVLAYLDEVINDLTVRNLKRKGNAVLLFVTDTAQESAIALSKMITPLGRKEQMKIALAIVEISTKNTYFLGNVQTKCRQMIANFVMNCELPIKDEFIHKDKLPYQYALAEKMEEFNLADFKAGKFYIH